MFKTKTVLPVLIAAMFLSIAVISIAEDVRESDRIERTFKSSRSAVLVSLFKRLPKLWSIRRDAVKLAPSLPHYSGEVDLPDSKTIFSWIEALCSAPNRRPGTPGDAYAEKWIAGKFEEFGLENVQADPVDITLWQASNWSLSADGKKIDSFFVVNTGFTGPEGITAPLVYVGEGTERDFKGLDVSGKIVVAETPFPAMPYGILFKTLKAYYAFSDPQGSITKKSSQYLNFVRENFLGGSTEKDAPPNDVYWNAYKRGAKAVCMILKDQPSNSNTHYGPYDGIMKPMPALWIGKYDGEGLRETARAGKEATLVLEGSKQPGVMHNVWGTLPGMSDEVILVTSHHDSPFTGASEDAAGSSQVLAQAWAWSKVSKERRPKTMVFVIDGGHFYGSKGAFSFAREHPDIMKRAKILITLEHLGAKDVEEKDREYSPTGNLALTVMFTSNEPLVIATVIDAFEKTKPKRVAAIPYDFFGPTPTSDAAGYVAVAGVPVISWIGCPYYLLDDQDTLDKIDVDELNHISSTVAQLVKTYMALK